jgi:pimeloyl-ACP methyl ester carboxylesterase
LSRQNAERSPHFRPKNRRSARHDGLAPIVLVVDQLGNPAIDPLCLDTAKYGKAQTFVTQDAVDWARVHLHILQDAAHWTIAGYSNGGECALSFGAKFPDIWSNFLDISGEKFPGSDRAAQTLAAVFHGNAAADPGKISRWRTQEIEPDKAPR